MEEETQVVFGVEERLLAEEEREAASVVGPLEGRAARQAAADEGDAEARLAESRAGAMDTLVGDEVVGDR